MSYYEITPFEAEYRLPYELFLIKTTLQQCKEAFGNWATYEGEGFLNGIEAIVLQFGVSVPTRSQFGILKHEKVAITYSGNEQHPLKAFALRRDFPALPHVNLSPKDCPVDLCLFDTPFMDVMHKDSPIGYVQRVKGWLDRAAVGELHLEEQGIEPFILNTVGDIVINSDIELKITRNRSGLFYGPKLLIQPSEQNKKLYVEVSSEIDNGDSPFILFHIKGQATSSQCINYTPSNYLELVDLLETKLSINLDKEIHSLLKMLHTSKAGFKRYIDRSLILMICIPRLSSSGVLSGHEILAFHLHATLIKLGILLGVIKKICRKRQEPAIVLLNEIVRDKKELSKVLPFPFSVVRPLTRKLANEMAGIGTEKASTTFTAIGLGALGSQVVMNLAKQGFINWSLVDSDILLPHNFARHSLSAFYRGNSKALSLKREMEVLIENANPRHAYDDLRTLLPKKDSLIFQSDILLDFTASYSAFLDLAYLEPERPRAVSSYMCGGGFTSVLISECLHRAVRLDDIDLQLKILALENDIVRSIYRTIPRRQLIYSLSCSSRTSIVPQDFVAIHAGIVTRQLKAIIGDSSGRCFVNLIEEDGFGVTVQEFTPHPVTICQSRDWQFRIAQSALNEMSHFRIEKLPNETGGVLIGWINSFRKIIYVGKALPAPPDSEERPYYFRRGKKGLYAQVQNIRNSSNDDLCFVGEWHSHPQYCSISQSPDDLKAMAALKNIMLESSLPGIMIIIGDDNKIGCYVDYGWKVN